MSREYTTDEVRSKFLEHIRLMIDYWDNLPEKSPKEKLEGLAFSICVTLDGGSANLPGFIVSPVSSKEDVVFYKGNGENYYPLDDKTHSKLKCDIAGVLHEMLYR